MIEDAFAAMFGGLPQWLVALIALALLLLSVFMGAKLSPWAKALLSAARAGAFAALLPKLRLRWPKFGPPVPHEVPSDAGPDPESPAHLVTSDGSTIRIRTDEEIAEDERLHGPGGG